MLKLREASDRSTSMLKAVLPPKSRLELVVSGAFRPPRRREFAHFGSRSWIVPPAVVEGAEHIWLGADVVVMEHSEIRAHPMADGAVAQPLVRMGHRCRLARFATIWATVGVHFGDGVSTSDKVSVVDCWRQPGSPSGEVPPPEPAPVVIEDGAYLGYGCVVGPGVTVGNGAFVGEGAVVMSDVPPHSVVYGNPARITSRLAPDQTWHGEMFGGPA